MGAKQGELMKAIVEFERDYGKEDDRGVSVYQKALNKLLFVLCKKHRIIGENGIRATDFLFNAWQNWKYEQVEQEYLVRI